MPAWILGIILDLVLKFGIPSIVDWIKKRFGVGVSSRTVQVLSDYVEEAKTDKKGAKRRARRRLRECHGVACPSDLVKE